MIAEDSRGDNEFFLNASWAVMHSLIDENQDEIEKKCNETGSSYIAITDIIDIELSIITLYKPYLDDHLKNNKDIIYPFLFSKGLIPLSKDADFRLANGPKFYNPDNHLNLSFQDSVDFFHDFHMDLLIHNIPYTKNSVLKFYFYYQIIESLMEVVLTSVCEYTVSQISLASNDATKNHDILERHKKHSSEKYRINQVFNYFLESPLSELETLKKSCILFLTQVDNYNNRADNQDAAYYFYSVRNHLMHNFRRVGINNKYLLDVVNCLDVIVPEILYKFKKRDLGSS